MIKTEQTINRDQSKYIDVNHGVECLAPLAGFPKHGIRNDMRSSAGVSSSGSASNNSLCLISHHHLENA